MRGVWGTVDRWGPGAIAVLTFIVCAALGWQYGVRIARIETLCTGNGASAQKQIDALQAQFNAQLVVRAEIETSMRAEVQMWQTYVIALRGDMLKAGVEVEPLPTKPAK